MACYPLAVRRARDEGVFVVDHAAFLLLSVYRRTPNQAASHALVSWS
jgi:hypothetical protein